MNINSKRFEINVRVFKSDLQISILDFVEKATDNIGQNFRTGKPFNDVEYIVGLKAYSIWLEGYLKNKDEDYLEMDNVTARNAAIITIRALKTFPVLYNFVENYYENFNYENEIKLVTTSSRELFEKYQEEWEYSLSRATILICRGLAYNYSGFENNLTGIIKKVYPSYIEKAINEWMRNYS
jgi:sulfur relay (sulfurtransferase) DsrC/TusE family protein